MAGTPVALAFAEDAPMRAAQALSLIPGRGVYGCASDRAPTPAELVPRPERRIGQLYGLLGHANHDLTSGWRSV
jgi:hypothetical protein